MEATSTTFPIRQNSDSVVLKGFFSVSFSSLSVVLGRSVSYMRRPMASKFWPKGGLPGILHHYVSFRVRINYGKTN
jgi:hypothetical protein